MINEECKINVKCKMNNEKFLCLTLPEYYQYQ